MGEPKKELANKHESVSETWRVVILEAHFELNATGITEEISNVGMLPLLLFERL